MSAFEELAELGYFGRSGLELLGSLMSEEVPKLRGLRTEIDRGDSIEDFVHDFFVAKGAAVTLGVSLACTDDDSMGRYLRKSIHRWLIDRVRKTGMGKLRRSIEGALKADAYVKDGAGRWRLTDAPAVPYSGDTDVLVSAALVAQLEKDATAHHVHAVLTAANGSLEVGELSHAISRTRRELLDPVYTPLEDADSDVVADFDPTPEQILLEREAASGIERRAAIIVAELSGDERELLPILDDVPAIQKLLGCGRSTAYERSSRLRALLQQLIPRDSDAVAVVGEVMRSCGHPRTVGAR